MDRITANDLLEKVRKVERERGKGKTIRKYKNNSQ